jgi:hypothetical protein
MMWLSNPVNAVLDYLPAPVVPKSHGDKRLLLLLKNDFTNNNKQFTIRMMPFCVFATYNYWTVV